MQLLLPLLLILQTEADTANSSDRVSAPAPEQVALGFISAFFIERNTERACSFVAPEAERKSYGEGSLIRDIRKSEQEEGNELTLQEIHVAKGRELERLLRRTRVFVTFPEATTTDCLPTNSAQSADEDDALVDVELFARSIAGPGREFPVTDTSLWVAIIFRATSTSDGPPFSRFWLVVDQVEGEYKIVLMSDP